MRIPKMAPGGAECRDQTIPPASLRNVLPQEHVRPALDKQRLIHLIYMIGNIRVGDEEDRSGMSLASSGSIFGPGLRVLWHTGR